MRGIGLLGSRTSAQRDIENIVVAAQKGTPVRVRDVADVDIGNAPRLGIVGSRRGPRHRAGHRPDALRRRDAADARGDPRRRSTTSARTTSCRRGWTSSPTTTAATLVKITTHTVIENLLVGMALVTVVLFVFLGSRARGAHHGASTSRSRCSSPSSAWSRRGRRRTSSRSARSTSASSSTPPSS